MVIGWIGKLANAYSGLGEWTKNIIAWTVMLGGALLLFGSKIGMLFKPISGLTSWFKSLFTASDAAGKQGTQVVKDWKTIAQNMVSFINEFKAISPKAVIMMPAASIALGVSAPGFAVFAMASKKLEGIDADKLPAVGAGIAGFAKEIGQITLGQIVKMVPIGIALAFIAIPLPRFATAMETASRTDPAKYTEVGKGVAGFVSAIAETNIMGAIKMGLLSIPLTLISIPLSIFTSAMQRAQGIDPDTYIKAGEAFVGFINRFGDVTLKAVAMLVTTGLTLAAASPPLILFVGAISLIMRGDTARYPQVGQDSPPRALKEDWAVGIIHRAESAGVVV
jgi:hypothetical protein